MVNKNSITVSPKKKTEICYVYLVLLKAIEHNIFIHPNYLIWQQNLEIFIFFPIYDHASTKNTVMYVTFKDWRRSLSVKNDTNGFVIPVKHPIQLQWARLFNCANSKRNILRSKSLEKNSWFLIRLEEEK